MIKNNFAEADGGNPHASSCLSMQPCKSHPVYNGSVNDLFSLHCRVESYLMINTYKFKSVYNHLQLSEDLHTSRSPPLLFPLQGVKTPNMNEAGGKKCSSASRGLFIPLCRLCGNWNIPPQAASWTVTRRKRERRVSCRAGVMIVAAGEQGPCHSVLFDWAADDSPRCLAV